MAPRRDLRTRVKDVLQTINGASEVPRTSRTTLLALSEIARRAGGDLPGGGELGLSAYELRVFSQNGEDGVLAELLRRVGTTNRHFVEFGGQRGLEGNCVLLADAFGWSGLFLEADPVEYAELERKYGPQPHVSTRQALVTPEGVEALFAEDGVPAEPDVLSIDIDGSDYYVWEALEAFRPRVVVIEYNAELAPGTALVQPRDSASWDHSAFYGASLTALRRLGERKGYRLVHTELTGNNAFFVRADLPGRFPAPDDVPQRAANHWLRGERHPPDGSGRPFVRLAD